MNCLGERVDAGAGLTPKVRGYLKSGGTVTTCIRRGHWAVRSEIQRARLEMESVI